jgi:hypothetical protein
VFSADQKSNRMRETENVLIDESQTSTADRQPAIVATVVQQPEAASDDRRRSAGGQLRLATAAILLIAFAALAPTVGDFGLTWDEPAYRYSQIFSAQWWDQVGKIRTRRDVHEVLDPLNLLYYWPYARHGLNFHPPLAGQLNLVTYAVFGHWMKDVPARRMASVIEFAFTVTIIFHFLARR